MTDDSKTEYSDLPGPSGCWIRYLVFVFVGIILLGMIFSTAFEVVWLALFGWVLHLIRVAPEMTYNVELIGLSVIYFVGFLVGLHLFWSWLRRARATDDPPPPLPRSRTIAAGVLIIVMFASGIATTGVVHQFGWLMNMDQRMFYDSGRAKARRMNCAGNLKQIGMGLTMYAADDTVGNYLPNDLSVIAEQKYLPDGKVYGCSQAMNPSTTAKDSDYVYVGAGLRVTDPNRDLTVLAYDKFDNHRAWVNVLFLDGRVEGFVCESPTAFYEMARVNGWRIGY